MSPEYNRLKAYDVIYRFLKLAPEQRLEKSVLSKLIALAEREAIRTTTSPIIGATFYHTLYGPALWEVLGDLPLWFSSDYFEGSQEYCLTDDDGPNLELSDYEIGVIERIWAQYKNIQYWTAVADIQYVFPEWKCPRRTTLKGAPIPLEHILEVGLGFSAEEAKTRAAEIRYYSKVGSTQ